MAKSVAGARSQKGGWQSSAIIFLFGQFEGIDHSGRPALTSHRNQLVHDGPSGLPDVAPINNIPDRMEPCSGIFRASLSHNFFKNPRRDTHARTPYQLANCLTMLPSAFGVLSYCPSVIEELTRQFHLLSRQKAKMTSCPECLEKGSFRSFQAENMLAMSITDMTFTYIHCASSRLIGAVISFISGSFIRTCRKHIY